MPKTKKTHPVIKIIKAIKKYQCAFLGVMTYLLILIAMVWVSPLIILKWIARSSANPVVTLWLIGIFLSSTIYGLIKLSGSVQIQISPFSINLDANRKTIACLFGLPYWIIIILLTTGSIGIIYTRPLCQPPVVLVTATYENENVKSISPGGTFNTTLDSSALFRASALSATAIVCEWEYSGSAILSLEPRNGCDVRIAFSQTRGEIGVVALSATDSQCTQRNIFPFNVVIK